MIRNVCGADAKRRGRARPQSAAVTTGGAGKLASDGVTPIARGASLNATDLASNGQAGDGSDGTGLALTRDEALASGNARGIRSARGDRSSLRATFKKRNAREGGKSDSSMSPRLRRGTGGSRRGTSGGTGSLTGRVRQSLSLARYHPRPRRAAFARRAPPLVTANERMEGQVWERVNVAFGPITNVREAATTAKRDVVPSLPPPLHPG